VTDTVTRAARCPAEAPPDRVPPRVSVIVPCRNEARYVAACLDSILATRYPPHRLEVLVVDGGSSDGTRAIVERYAARHPTVRLLDNPRGIVPAALNQGVRAATGDVIARMDAHVVYPPDYLPRLVDALARSGADNVGGCVRTLAADGSVVARAIARALSHPFGVGNSAFRVGATAPRLVDTVPFGCYRREVFDRIGLFDEELVRDQDEEFNHRLIRRGGRVLLLPDVVSGYYARGTYRQLARMFYQYGWFKPLVARKVGRVMTVRQLVPPAFTAALMLAALLAPWWRPAALALAVLGAAYLSAVVAAVLVTEGRALLALAAAFPILHLSYGIGFLRGAWRLVRRGPHPGAVPLSR
jgi:glycosyltransferase involved in cell wall biosynthesis